MYGCLTLYILVLSLALSGMFNSSVISVSSALGRIVLAWFLDVEAVVHSHCRIADPRVLCLQGKRMRSNQRAQLHMWKQMSSALNDAREQDASWKKESRGESK